MGVAGDHRCDAHDHRHHSHIPGEAEISKKEVLNQYRIALFALQDEITLKILTATQVELTRGEQASGLEKYFGGEKGLECYLKYLEAHKYDLGHNAEDNRVAHRIADEVIAMCPGNPAGYFLLGWVYQLEYWLGYFGKSPQDSLEKGIETLRKGLAIDDSIALAHAVLGNLYALKRDHEMSIVEGERAIALEPGGADVQLWYGISLNYVAGQKRPFKRIKRQSD